MSGAGLASPSAAIGNDGWSELSEVEERRPMFLWSPCVPADSITVVAGDPGVGKSELTLELAARISPAAAGRQRNWTQT